MALGRLRTNALGDRSTDRGDRTCKGPKVELCLVSSWTDCETPRLKDRDGEVENKFQRMVDGDHGGKLRE